MAVDAFAYVVVVPDRLGPSSGGWQLLPVEPGQGEAPKSPLFGPAPTLAIADAAPPADANPARPWVLRSQLTLSGEGRRGWCHVDRSLTAALHPGDEVHLARTERGGLGLSVLRRHRLIVAVAAVTAVPLGEDVQARVAPDRHDAILVMPELAELNPLAQCSDEWPLELRIGRETHLLMRRNQDFDGIQVFMARGFHVRPKGAWPWGSAKPSSVRGVGGLDECVALCRIGQCSTVGASASAFLLATDGLTLG